MSQLEPSNATPRGRVSFIGAGPGAADLMTIRAANRLAEADIVVWAASLVTVECVRDHARPDAEMVDSSRITHEQVIDIYRRALRDRLKVARVHSGDPSLWGAVQEQYDACLRMDLDVEIVPGVSAFSAAAAVIGRELTVPEVAQSVVLTRLEGGKTPMPEKERIRDFAKHGTTMAIFLSAAGAGQLAEELREGGYAEDTPIVVAYKVTWPDELVLHTTLGELETTVKGHKLWRHTLFLVGQALRAGGTRSRLYHSGHFHTYRKADKAARRALRAGRTEQTSECGPVDAAIVPMPGQAQAESRPSAAGQPDAATAWWAVRNWQETARTSGRSAPARPRGAKRPAQDGLFDGGSDATEAGTAIEGGAEIGGPPAEPSTPALPYTAPAGDATAEAADPAHAAPAELVDDRSAAADGPVAADDETRPNRAASGSAAAAASAPPRVTARVNPRTADTAEPTTGKSAAASTESASRAAKPKSGGRKAGQPRGRRKATGSS